jgi:hypothetical protein
LANPAIERDTVHQLAESCSDEGDAFQATAHRLIKGQRRLARFIEANVTELGGVPAQVALYMLSVTLRIFEQVGGRLNKVTGQDIDQAAAKVQGHLADLLPFDEGFDARARQLDRAQPHVLDEVLWALYEREEQIEGEASLEPEQSAMVYLVLWTAVEAIDAKWRAPESVS